MIVLSGLIGAFIGACVGLFFNIWKFHRDERSARCDELCAALTAGAVVSAEYWASAYDDTPTQRVQEARIYGAQALIDGLFDDLRIVIAEDDAELIDVALSDVFDKFSGGQFSVKGRSPDPGRVAGSTQAASLAIVEIRRSHRRTFPLKALISAYHDSKRRKLDMPTNWPEGA
ncbi:hypothetical protein LB566_10850 [Mesorhizobium sp. CA13]|uniref:hypothetical protein n=1 Tax=Mesorhizobium sp. CA13 TaxID=2876643 RepID=UPI001CCB9574|nr:hypothetical protein [Mesorhizobium sp. CA13]MBZ9854303.1 hypothetical protein [Mesorhizobium sp. CA13]